LDAHLLGHVASILPDLGMLDVLRSTLTGQSWPVLSTFSCLEVMNVPFSVCRDHYEEWFTFAISADTTTAGPISVYINCYQDDGTPLEEVIMVVDTWTAVVDEERLRRGYEANSVLMHACS
jgi:hypothetical protein